MLIQCIFTELIKLRRAPIWIAFVSVPAVSALIGNANYSTNLDILTPGWENLWSQHTLFTCYFFLPALIGAGASYLWRLEHEGSNWNELMVMPVPARDVFLAKLVVCALLDLVAFSTITTFFIVSGLVLHVPGTFPFAVIAGKVALGWLSSLAICSIQLVLSMLVRNFAVPVGIGLGGGILGILATMGGFDYLFPYSLMQSVMTSNALVVPTPSWCQRPRGARRGARCRSPRSPWHIRQFPSWRRPYGSSASTSWRRSSRLCLSQPPVPAICPSRES